MALWSRVTAILSVIALVFSIFLATWLNPPLYLPSIFDKTTTYCYEDVKTQSPRLPHAKCFSVSSAGLITKVYANVADAPKHHHKSEGAVIPGLWDGHGHLLQLGELLKSVDLFGSQSLGEALQRVERYVETHEDAGSAQKWIRGVGWDQAAFGRMPIADDFNELTSLKDKYIMLDRVDVHCIWVSNAVLALLPDHIPPISGGEIITDPPGRGVFCDNAMDVVLQQWPRTSDAEKTQFVSAAMKHLNSVGIVGIHDAGVTPGNLNLFQKLVSSHAKDWTVRVYAMLECEPRNTFCAVDARRFSRTNIRDRLWVRSVKLFADGALGSWGSAMLEPYTDRPEATGSLLVNGSTLTTLTRDWADAGYQVNIHAIGDRANRLVIDAFEAALHHLCGIDIGNGNITSPTLQKCQAHHHHRFRIEHAQIIHSSDQERIHAWRGIITPSIQPTHATSDMTYAERRLGHHRTATEAYRMHSLLSLAPVLGSDFPVEPADPLHGMYAAVARQSPASAQRRTGHDSGREVSDHGDDKKKEGWYAEEAISMDDALAGFTVNAARAAFLQGRAGLIEEGAFADWVVLDVAWDQIAVDDLLELKVRETWSGGRLVYARY